MSGVIVGLSDIMYIQVSRLFHLEHEYDMLYFQILVLADSVSN